VFVLTQGGTEAQVCNLAARLARSVGRGLSLADTQTDCYGRLYSRGRLRAKLDADARCSFWILVLTAERPNPILLYNWVLDTVTCTGPIPPITVSRVNAYSGGVLARALSEGLRYLSTWAWLSSDSVSFRKPTDRSGWPKKRNKNQTRTTGPTINTHKSNIRTVPGPNRFVPGPNKCKICCPLPPLVMAGLLRKMTRNQMGVFFGFI